MIYKYETRGSLKIRINVATRDEFLLYSVLKLYELSGIILYARIAKISRITICTILPVIESVKISADFLTRSVNFRMWYSNRSIHPNFRFLFVVARAHLVISKTSLSRYNFTAFSRRRGIIGKVLKYIGPRGVSLSRDNKGD